MVNPRLAGALKGQQGKRQTARIWKPRIQEKREKRSAENCLFFSWLPGFIRNSPEPLSANLAAVPWISSLPAPRFLIHLCNVAVNTISESAAAAVS